jgi:Family of unknown function (DUF6130)
MRARLEGPSRSMGQLAVAAVAGGALLATNAVAQSAREVRDATPYLAIENEPPPKLIVDPPLAAALTQVIVWIQYRVENVHIVPVFGTGALNVSPRVGHLHIHSTICLGCGRTRVVSIQSTWPEYRPASTRCTSTWSTRTIRSSLDARCAARR